MKEQDRERKWTSEPDQNTSEPNRELTPEEAEFYDASPHEHDGPAREPLAEDRHGDELAREDPTRGDLDEDGYEAAGAAAPAPPRERTTHRAETRRPSAGTEAAGDVHDTAAASGNVLFPTEEAESLRRSWDAIQTEFVDEPRSAVERADDLVGDVMQRLTDGFNHERTRLEEEWDRGDSVSTEELRVALKRYRSFFDRLLSV